MGLRLASVPSSEAGRSSDRFCRSACQLPAHSADKLIFVIPGIGGDALRRKKGAPRVVVPARVAMPFNPEKLKKLQLRAKTSRTGGKGSIRRKKKTVRKSQSHDDKRLTSTLKRLNVRDIPAIEEVNLFKEDSTVIHFASPKVQASIAANTYVVSGNAENKKLQDLLPGIISQLGPDNLEHLKKIYSSYSSNAQPGAEGKAAEDDDDDVPELLQNFEDATKEEDGDDDDLPELV